MSPSPPEPSIETAGGPADVFSPDAVDDETLRQIAQVEALIAKSAPLNERPAAQAREERARGGGTFPKPPLSPRARERTIDGDGGAITLREFVPEKPAGVYLHIHGGGWTLGSADGQDPALEHLSDTTNLAVVSVDYRLAPETPYPAAPDDCEAAALWLSEHAAREYATEVLYIGGESAGAHLALITLLRLRDRHAFTGFRGACLTYGMYDLGGTPSVRNWGTRNLVLNTPIIAWFVGNFLPPELIAVERLKDPDISPLFADLKDLPPAHFTVGTLDPLLDDTLFLHQRWRAAGHRASLHIAPGGIHGFNALPGPLASEANARIAAFLAGSAAGDEEDGGLTLTARAAG